MDKRFRWAAALGFAGLAMMLVAALDPLEGFPLVLTGGALAAIAARLVASRWFRLLAWGWALAALGCAAMVFLSAIGGVGGSAGLPALWALTVVPYPVGGILLLVGGVFLVPHLLRGGGSRGDRGTQSTP